MTHPVTRPEALTGNRERVLIVDDEPLFLDLVAEALRRRNFQVAACTTPEQALQVAQRAGFDIACLDIDMRASINGFELARELREIREGAPIVYLTMLFDVGFLNSTPTALEGSSYLLKSGLADTNELVSAIHSALAGQFFVSQEVIGIAETNQLRLTSHQLSLMRLMARGMSNQAIADELGITPSAVVAAIGRIAKALGVKADAETNLRVACVSMYLRTALRGQPD